MSVGYIWWSSSVHVLDIEDRMQSKPFLWQRSHICPPSHWFLAILHFRHAPCFLETSSLSLLELFGLVPAAWNEVISPNRVPGELQTKFSRLSLLLVALEVHDSKSDSSSSTSC